MRIAYLIHSLHTAGGMEKVVCTKANWFSRQIGMEVYIITAHMKGRKPFFELDPAVKLLDIGVNERHHGRKYRHKLDTVLHDIRPDVTISLCGADAFHLYKCTDGSAKLAEYHFMHDKFFRKYRCRAYAAFRTRRLHNTFLHYDKLVVLSHYDYDYFKELYLSKGADVESICQIYNAVDIDNARVSGLGRKRFIAVGRLSAEKNFEDAVRIWQKVSVRHPDWRLDIYGAGRQMKHLEEFIIGKGMSDYISLCGNSPKILEEFAESSGMLLTSNYEGMGLVVIEAGSCGVPAVAYRCPGGISEVLAEGAGFLVKMGDVDSAVGNVCKLIEDDELRLSMGEKAREYAQNFAPDRIMRCWMSLFADLMEKKC